MLHWAAATLAGISAAAGTAALAAADYLDHLLALLESAPHATAADLRERLLAADAPPAILARLKGAVVCAARGDAARCDRMIQALRPAVCKTRLDIVYALREETQLSDWLGSYQLARLRDQCKSLSLADGSGAMVALPNLETSVLSPLFSLQKVHDMFRPSSMAQLLYATGKRVAGYRYRGFVLHQDTPAWLFASVRLGPPPLRQLVAEPVRELGAIALSTVPENAVLARVAFYRSLLNWGGTALFAVALAALTVSLVQLARDRRSAEADERHLEAVIARQRAAAADLDHDDPFLCTICLSQHINCAFTACGHEVACMACAQQVSICPVCRKRIPPSGRLRVYHA